MSPVNKQEKKNLVGSTKSYESFKPNTEIPACSFSQQRIPQDTDKNLHFHHSHSRNKMVAQSTLVR